MELTAGNVTEIFITCLYEDNVPHEDAVMVEGVLNTYGLNPKKLELHKQSIIDMVDELPSTFREDSDGHGWSFLNMCFTKNDEQWTSYQTIMEQLYVLGIAIDKIKCLLPKDCWESLPGGVPYFCIKS